MLNTAKKIYIFMYYERELSVKMKWLLKKNIRLAKVPEKFIII